MERSRIRIPYVNLRHFYANVIQGAQSCRRASIASVREARYAGIQLAATATAIIVTATTANVAGSIALTL